MTQDDVIRMAKEAGFECNSLGMTYTSGQLSDLLKSFAALVAAAEREACAKVCEEVGTGKSGLIHVQAWGCAKAIRARGL